jgi:protein arginine kinase activator
MLCPECNKREATIHLTQIVNNQKISVSMCQECAEKFGFHSPLDNGPFPLAEILSGMSKDLPQRKRLERSANPECPKCGMTFEEFAQRGRFGCGACYTAFRPYLEDILRKIHGASLHRGQNPAVKPDDEDSSTLPVKEEERLGAELARAIKEEDFERAAELRDKLKAMRQSVSVDD